MGPIVSKTNIKGNKTSPFSLPIWNSPFSSFPQTLTLTERNPNRRTYRDDAWGMKARLVGATRGLALLKKKSDALTVQFRAILKKIVITKESMGDIMRASSFALTEAKYATGDNIRHVVLESVRTDELEREDFFRIKKIQGYKKREVERQMLAAKNYADEKFARRFR